MEDRRIKLNGGRARPSERTAGNPEEKGLSVILFTRKRGQKVIVANAIEITVLEITKAEVRLGIDAPNHIAVRRSEIHEQLKRESPSAAQSQIPDEHTLEKILKEPE